MLGFIPGFIPECSWIIPGSFLEIHVRISSSSNRVTTKHEDKTECHQQRRSQMSMRTEHQSPAGESVALLSSNDPNMMTECSTMEWNHCVKGQGQRHVCQHSVAMLALCKSEEPGSSLQIPSSKSVWSTGAIMQ
jgi:hypothetical protein